ncbi:unnamed protein product [Amoebophrya sp. A120]|nr:unnamed protein product [Amoebophrya sp. A120]|eukprot:GSA120T00011595001.1
MLASSGGVFTPATRSDVLLTDDVFLRSPYAPLAQVYYKNGEQGAALDSTTISSSEEDPGGIDAVRMLDYGEFFGRELAGGATTLARCRRSVKKFEWMLCLDIVHGPPAQSKTSSSNPSGSVKPVLKRGAFFSTSTSGTNSGPGSPALTRNLWLDKLRALRLEYAEIKEQYKIDLAATVKRAQKNPTKFNPLSKAEDNPWEQVTEDEELMQEIAKDVERTYSDKELFTRKDVRGILQQVLYNWCKQFNPSKKAAESYRQGMNELCAIAYQVTHDSLTNPSSSMEFLREFGNPEAREADCFLLFRALMGHGFTPLFAVQAPIYTTKASPRGADIPGAAPGGLLDDSSNKPVVEVQNPQTVILDKCNHIMEVLLKKVEPELHRLLVDTYAVPAQVFLLRWVRLLFCREFSVESTLDLWAEMFQDAFLNEEPTEFTLGSYFAVAMLRYVKAELLASDESACLSRLMKYPPVEIEPLLKMAKQVRFQVEPDKKFSVGLEKPKPVSHQPEYVPLPGTTVVMPASSPPLQPTAPAGSAALNLNPPPLMNLTTATTATSPASTLNSASMMSTNTNKSPLFATPGAGSSNPLAPGGTSGGLSQHPLAAASATVPVHSVSGPLFPTGGSAASGAAPRPLFPGGAASAPAQAVMSGANANAYANYNPQNLLPITGNSQATSSTSVNWEEQYGLLKEKARVKVNELNEKIAALTQSVDQQTRTMYDAQRERVEALRTAEDLRLTKEQHTQQINHLRTQINKLQNKNLFEKTKKTNALFGEEDEDIQQATHLGEDGKGAESQADNFEVEVLPWRKRVDGLLEEKRKLEDERDQLQLETKQMIAGVENLKSQAKARVQELQQQLQQAQQAAGSSSTTATTPVSDAAKSTAAASSELAQLAELKTQHAAELEDLKQKARAKMQEMQTAFEQAKAELARKGGQDASCTTSTPSADVDPGRTTLTREQADAEIAKARQEVEARFAEKFAKVANKDAAASENGPEDAAASKTTPTTEAAADKKDDGGAAPAGDSTKTDTMKGTASKESEESPKGVGEASPKKGEDPPQTTASPSATEEKIAALQSELTAAEKKLQQQLEEAQTAQAILKTQAVAKMNEMKTAYDTALSAERVKVAELQQQIETLNQSVSQLQTRAQQLEVKLGGAKQSLVAETQKNAAAREQDHQAAVQARAAIEADLQAKQAEVARLQQRVKEQEDATEVAAHNFRVEAEETQRQMQVLKDQKEAELAHVKQVARERIEALQQQLDHGGAGAPGAPAPNGTGSGDVEAVRQEYEGILADFREQAKTKFAELNADKEALQASIDSLQASVEAKSGEITALQQSLSEKEASLQRAMAQTGDGASSSASAEFEVVGNPNPPSVEPTAEAARPAPPPAAGSKTNSKNADMSHDEIDKLFDDMEDMM